MITEKMDLNPKEVILKNEKGEDVVVKVEQEFRWDDNSPKFRLYKIGNNNGALRFYFETQKKDGSREESGGDEVVDEARFKKIYLKAMVVSV